MTIVSTPATLPTVRQTARDLLNEFDAADGLASYYALYHEPKRTTLFVSRDANQRAEAFLALCQTGFDLFRPLVTMRVRGDGVIEPLLREALLPGRPYLIVVPVPLLERVTPYVTLSEVSRNVIYRMDPRRFRAEMNVMVVTKTDRDGHPRAEIRSGDKVAAAAGINWRSPIFAEVFTHVGQEFRGRGWGGAVVGAVVSELIKAQVTPLYSAAEDNEASRALAERVGFVDTGAREVMAQAMLIVDEEPPQD